MSMDKKQQDEIDENLLNVQKAAAFLDVSVNTIRRWAQTKKLSGLKVGTRGDWRFTKEDLLKIVRRNDGQPIKNT